MCILAQHPTCRNPSCIHQIKTHRYNLLPIGSNTSHTSNAGLHYPNNTQQPTSTIQQPPSNTPTTDSTPMPSTTQQPPSNTPTTDSTPMPTNNLSSVQPKSNPSDSTTYSSRLNYPLPNNPIQYPNYHTNPTNPPMVSSLPTSPNIAVYPTNSLWSQPILFDNIWSHVPSTTFNESIRNHSFQGRAISCIFDQPLS